MSQHSCYSRTISSQEYNVKTDRHAVVAVASPAYAITLCKFGAKLAS